MDGYSTNDKGEQALLSEFSGPMRLGGHEAKVSFSYLVAVKIKDETSAAESATPSGRADEGQSAPTSGVNHDEIAGWQT